MEMHSNIPFFPNLEAEIAKSGIRKKDIAERLGLTQRTFSKKMSGEIDFWWNEVLTIYSFFPEIPPQILFAHEDRTA